MRVRGGCVLKYQPRRGVRIWTPRVAVIGFTLCTHELCGSSYYVLCENTCTVVTHCKVKVEYSFVLYCLCMVAELPVIVSTVK